MKMKNNSPIFFCHSFFVSLNSLAVVDAQGLHPLVGLYTGHPLGWWRCFSQLDVIKILITPPFCWVTLGIDSPVHSLRVTWVGSPQAREQGSHVEYIE
jgi:hypothetical protein